MTRIVTVTRPARTSGLIRPVLAVSPGIAFAVAAGLLRPGARQSRTGRGRRGGRAGRKRCGRTPRPGTERALRTRAQRILGHRPERTLGTGLVPGLRGGERAGCGQRVYLAAPRADRTAGTGGVAALRASAEARRAVAVSAGGTRAGAGRLAGRRAVTRYRIVDRRLSEARILPVSRSPIENARRLILVLRLVVAGQSPASRAHSALIAPGVMTTGRLALLVVLLARPAGFVGLRA